MDFDSDDDRDPWTVVDAPRDDDKDEKPMAKRGIRAGNGYILKSEF